VHESPRREGATARLFHGHRQGSLPTPMPGDTVHYHVQKRRSRGRVWRYRGQALVAGTLVAEAEISAVIVKHD